MLIFELYITESLTDAECANAFAGIPEETTHLNIHLANIPEGGDGTTNPRFISDEGWVNAMKSLSTKIIHLKFTFIGLSNLNTEELKNIFAAIPPSVTELDLSDNSLGLHDKNVLVEILPALHQSIRKLHLGHNNLGLSDLGTRRAQNFFHIISALPPQLTELSLVSNHLDNLPAIKLIQALLALPSTLKSLDLGSNLFNSVLTRLKYSLDDFRGIIRSLPRGLSSLDLSHNFAGIFPNWIAEIARELPSSLSSLKLDMAPYTCILPEEALFLFSFMSCTLTTLDIGRIDLAIIDDPYTRVILPEYRSWHQVRQRSFLEMMSILRGIPSSVTALSIKIPLLDTGDNISLYNASHYQLLQLFSALPATVTQLHADVVPMSLRDASIKDQGLLKRFQSLTKLDLSGNNLGSKTIAELTGIFNIIPNTVPSLNLRNNNFEKISTDKLIELFSLIPASVTYLDLTGNPIFGHKETTWRGHQFVLGEKKPHECDAILNALHATNSNRVIDVRDCGEAPVARAFLPLMSAVKQNKLPFLVSERILSYLFSPKGNKKIKLGEVSTRIIDRMRKPH